MPELQQTFAIAQDFDYQGDDWWSWWIWIEADAGALDGVDHVVYTLHPTFFNPVRKVSDRHTKFQLKTEGWGTFPVYARVVLKDGQSVDLSHELQLMYPDGTENTE